MALTQKDLAAIAEMIAASQGGDAEQAEPSKPKSRKRKPKVELPTWASVGGESKRVFGVVVTKNGYAYAAFADEDSQVKGAPRHSDKSDMYGIGGVRRMTGDEVRFACEHADELLAAQEAADKLNEARASENE